jgi:hypothetical protein
LSAANAALEVASSVANFGFSTTQSTAKGHHAMSSTEKLIKARMGMLALAEQLNNVSAACRRAGISRSHYYEIKEAFEKFRSRWPGGCWLSLPCFPSMKQNGVARYHKPHNGRCEV